jgi:hypothetical protein
MTSGHDTPPRPYRAARARRGLLAALVGFLLILAGIVVGAVPAADQNAVGASTPALANTVGPSAGISAGQRLGKVPPQPQIVVATAVAAEDAAGASRVNPLGGTQNCVHCAIAGDATLSGAPASALDSAGPQLISRIEQQFGSSFKPVAGRAEIEQMLSEAGPGSRGIVFGSRGADPGHVFNAINQGGSIRFIDFQSGTGASFEGYQGFSFLWTTP